MSLEDKEALTAKAYELLERCEADVVQSQLSEWDRGFLNSNLERKEKGAPITSEKVIKQLERIAAYADRSPTDKLRQSRRWEGFGGPR